MQGHYERSSILGLPIDFISFQKQSVKYRTFSSRIVTIAIPYIPEVQIVHNRPPETKNLKKNFFP